MQRLILFFGLFLLIGVAPVLAQDSRQPICFMTLAPLAEGETISRVLDEACFNNLAEAAAYFSDGAIQLSHSASFEEYETAMAARLNYVITRFYDWTNFQQPVLVTQASQPCGAVSYGGDFPTSLWGTLESASGEWCKHTQVWENTGQWGVTFTCSPDAIIPNCPTFYSLNNKVKSWRSWGAV